MDRQLNNEDDVAARESSAIHWMRHAAGREMACITGDDDVDDNDNEDCCWQLVL